MLLVSKKILDDVMRRKVSSLSVKLDEAEYGKSDAFMSICKKARQEFTSSNGVEIEFRNAMVDFMHTNQQIVRYVGIGSSRMTFAMSDGTALKLAFSRAGIAQNKHEADICMDPKVKYRIFPDFYAVDDKDWLLLNCELCSPGHEQMFYDIFNCTLEDIVDVIEFIVTLNLSDEEIKDVYSNYLKTKAFGCANFAKFLINGKREADKAMLSLIQFYRDYGSKALVAGDLRNPENWGYTIRNGQSTMLVIDAGLDDDISQMYYSSIQN